ncbi:MAG: RNA polymerase sigma factor [Clostridiales bacterium]|nr:RNA polymerase sigma factor [Clostridiales bacterium]
MTKIFFEQQVFLLADTMHRVSATLLRRPVDRQDAMQNCLLKAWEKRNTLREESLFRPWLMRILVNECHTLLRKNRRLILTETMPETAVSPTDSSAVDMVMQLPEKIRLVVALYYMENAQVSEIAQILHIPSGTVKSRLSRGRQLLRGILEEEEA